MRIPPEAAAALSRHVSHSVGRLDPARYNQEPAYVIALLGRLDAVVYDKGGFFLELRSTVVTDRGPKSGESKWGADFGITALISDQFETVKKGILGQAKRGDLRNLPPHEAERFRLQGVHMSAATESLIGLEVPTAPATQPLVRILEVPFVYQGVPIQRTLRRFDSKIWPLSGGTPPLFLGEAMPIGRYLSSELIRCLHGDTSAVFLQGISESFGLPLLSVVARQRAEAKEEIEN